MGWTQEDSNLRPLGYQPSALPTAPCVRESPWQESNLLPKGLQPQADENPVVRELRVGQAGIEPSPFDAQSKMLPLHY